MSGEELVLALVGPTASGKSGTALELARRGLRRADGGSRVFEVVAVDAFTVYRGMDIGIAKPSIEDRAQVRHHLIDVLDPWEDVTVQWFQLQARAVIEEVQGRGNVPLLAGGSGLYFRAVVDDLRFPPTDPDVRGDLEDRFGDRPEEAHERLAALDAAAAAKIEPGNLRRSVRALEVIELTGEPFSSFADAWDDYRSIYPGLDVRGIDHEELRARIERRAREM
ncbi:MAG: tRNA (adenosine(37)-N6)-dimethylallyltransferase, partial [Nitriliruptorales bacterium]